MPPAWAPPAGGIPEADTPPQGGTTPPPPPPPGATNMPPWMTNLGGPGFSRDKLVRPRQGRYVAVLRDEHRRVEAVLGAASTGTPADPSWPDELIATLRLLREHILKEQDGVFPAALTSLSGADWDAVDAVRARTGTLLPTEI